MHPGEEVDFKGQLKYERFQFFFRRHWMKFFQIVVFPLPIAFLIIPSLMVMGYFFIGLDYIFLRAFFVFFSMILTFGLIAIGFIQVINYYFDLVIVTDCRVLVVKKSVFLRNNSDALDLTKIQDIGVEAHGILRNYLRYGSLVISLSTSAPPIYINYVPNPHNYLEWMNRVKREHIVHRQEKKHSPNSAAGASDFQPSDYFQDVQRIQAS